MGSVTDQHVRYTGLMHPLKSLSIMRVRRWLLELFRTTLGFCNIGKDSFNLFLTGRIECIKTGQCDYNTDPC